MGDEPMAVYALLAAALARRALIAVRSGRLDIAKPLVVAASSLLGSEPFFLSFTEDSVAAAQKRLARELDRCLTGAQRADLNRLTTAVDSALISTARTTTRK